MKSLTALGMHTVELRETGHRTSLSAVSLLFWPLINEPDFKKLLQPKMRHHEAPALSISSLQNPQDSFKLSSTFLFSSKAKMSKPTETERCIESLIAVFQKYSGKDGNSCQLSKTEFLTFMNTELAAFTKVPVPVPIC